MCSQLINVLLGLDFHHSLVSGLLFSMWFWGEGAWAHFPEQWLVIEPMSYFKRKGKFESGNLLLRVHDYLIWFCLGVFQFGIFGFTAYSPSKFAVRGFAETLFMEVSKSLVLFTKACLVIQGLSSRLYYSFTVIMSKTVYSHRDNFSFLEYTRWVMAVKLDEIPLLIYTLL